MNNARWSLRGLRSRYTRFRKFQTAAELGLTEKSLRDQHILSMEIVEELLACIYE